MPPPRRQTMLQANLRWRSVRRIQNQNRCSSRKLRPSRSLQISRPASKSSHRWCQRTTSSGGSPAWTRWHLHSWRAPCSTARWSGPTPTWHCSSRWGRRTTRCSPTWASYRSARWSSGTEMWVRRSRYADTWRRPPFVFSLSNPFAFFFPFEKRESRRVHWFQRPTRRGPLDPEKQISGVACLFFLN